jgi:diguanylate cyclase
MVPIGQWVMREAGRRVRSWQQAGLVVPSVAVNVSSVEFAAPRFLEGVFEVLNETGLEPSALELELNENALMTRVDATQAILEALAAAGVQLSVDDFGTGYSSLSNLRRFPIHMLKVDQSFIREITVKSGEANVVAAVLSMAQMLNLRVVAEGVETAEELAFLQRNRCDQAQGFYFSRPLPADEFSNLLRTGLVTSMARRRYAQPFGRLQNHALGSLT